MNQLTDKKITRLRHSRDFSNVMKHGRRSRGKILNLVACQNNLPYSRIGYSVNKSTGSAVTRNQIKRRLRAIANNHTIQPGIDIVAIPLKNAAKVSYDEIQLDFKSSITLLQSEL